MRKDVTKTNQIAAMINLPTSSFSDRTANSNMTPEPCWNVILHFATTLPPPPETIPDRFRVCTVVELGVSVPPSASMPSTSINDLQASAKNGQRDPFLELEFRD